MSPMDVVVATIGTAHGLRGEVSLLLRTDRPEERRAPGSAYQVEAGGGRRTLTVASTRTQQGRWYARFDEVTDRSDAESLRGVELSMQVDPDAGTEREPDAWYPSQLRGLEVRHIDGGFLGTVIDVEHYPAQDVLSVRVPDGRQVMLPFVEQLVPEVDPAAGVVRADPPGGLFEDLPEED